MMAIGTFYLLLLLLLTLLIDGPATQAASLSKITERSVGQPGDPCNAVLYTPLSGATVGYIAFPSSPGVYGNSLKCQWAITSPTTSSVIKVSFSMLDLEDSVNCEFDAVEIASADGNTVFKRYCGTKRLISEVIATSSILVRFTSDESLQGTGFNLTFAYKTLSSNTLSTLLLTSTTSTSTSTAAPVTSTSTSTTTSTTPPTTTTATSTTKITTSSNQDPKCTAIRTDNSTSGSIQFPPSGSYQASTHCYWSISASSTNAAIEITIVWIDIELQASCGYDYLRITSPTGQELNKLCGQRTDAQVFTYQYASLTIEFYSDIIVQKTGFSLRYRYKDAGAAPSTTLSFSTTPTPTTTTANIATSKCNAVRSDNSTGGQIQFPVSGNYQEYSDCTWTITASPSSSAITISIIWIDIEYNSACNYDSLRIFAPNGQQLAQLCGQNNNVQVSSYPYSSLTMEFTSDSVVQYHGFYVQYTYQSTNGISPSSATSMTTSTSPGTITTKPTSTRSVSADSCSALRTQNSTGGSIQFPATGMYQNGIDCTWSIQTSTAATGQTRLTFQYLDIEYASSCSADALRVLSTGGVLQLQFCGQQNATMSLIFPQSSLNLRFISSAAITAKGFSLSYAPNPSSTGQCISIHQIAADGGTIAYPPNDGGYSNNANCTWTVQAPVQGMLIDVYITRLSVEQCGGSSCTCDSLNIRDATSTAILRKLCGGKLGNAVVESFTVPSLQFQFTSDYSATSYGFTLTYKFRMPPTVTTFNTTCGSSSNAALSRIVGGFVSVPDSWPWMAFLQIGASSYCGGSLISDRWVVTAAHCLTGLKTPSDLIIRIGAYNLAGDRRPNEQWIRVDRFVINELYNSDNSHDIGLIKLTQPANATPVCLPARNEAMPPVGTELVATGWGEDQNDTFDETTAIQQVSMLLIDDSVCRTKFGTYDDGMLCSGYMPGGKDTCQGDSGGPLVQRQPNGQYKLIGLTSFGNNCGLPKSPGVYSKLSYFIDWINQKMAQP